MAYLLPPSESESSLHVVNGFYGGLDDKCPICHGASIAEAYYTANDGTRLCSIECRDSHNELTGLESADFSFSSGEPPDPYEDELENYFP